MIQGEKVHRRCGRRDMLVHRIMVNGQRRRNRRHRVLTLNWVWCPGPRSHGHQHPHTHKNHVGTTTRNTGPQLQSSYFMKRGPVTSIFRFNGILICFTITRTSALGEASLGRVHILITTLSAFWRSIWVLVSSINSMRPPSMFLWRIQTVHMPWIHRISAIISRPMLMR